VNLQLDAFISMVLVAFALGVMLGSTIMIGGLIAIYNHGKKHDDKGEPEILPGDEWKHGARESGSSDDEDEGD